MQSAGIDLYNLKMLLDVKLLVTCDSSSILFVVMGSFFSTAYCYKGTWKVGIARYHSLDNPVIFLSFLFQAQGEK